jgi:flagellar basal body P-ring formation protein FlgA
VSIRRQSWTAGFAACLVLALGSWPAAAGQVQVPVPRGVVYPGEVIGDAHLIEKPFQAEAVAGAAVFATRDALIGKVAKQTLLPNAPISLGAVRDPFAVKVGQPTVVVFSADGLVISGTAVSLQQGAVGEVISLRNTDSGTTIRGVIQGDGTVRVGSP